MAAGVERERGFREIGWKRMVVILSLDGDIYSSKLVAGASSFKIFFFFLLTLPNCTPHFGGAFSFFYS